MSAWLPKIEKNIPLPQSILRSSSKYPFDKLEIGESIFYPEGEVGYGTLTGAVQAFHKRAANYRPGVSKRLTLRTNKEAKGVRVWRVEDEKEKKE